MFYSTLLLAAAAFTGLASAQNYSTSGPLTVPADTVPADLRLSWCRAQINNCPEICGGQASTNTCDGNTLNYTCTCANGNTPNITAYQQTIPFFECQQWIANCVDAHPNDLTGQTACRSVTCGTLNATSAEVSGSSSSASASASATSSMSSASSGASSTASSAGSSGSATASSSGAAASASSSHSAAIALVAEYGTGVFAAGLLAAFGLAL